MSSGKPYSLEGYLDENYHYFHLRDTAGQERDFHFHDFDKLVILVEGKVRYLVENEDYELQPRDLLLVRHHCIHKALIDRSEPYERIIIYLSRGYFDRILPDARLMDCFDRADRISQHLLKPDVEQWSQLSGLLEGVEQNASSDISSQAMRDTLIMQLLILVGRLTPTESSEEADLVDPKIRSTLSFIGENLGLDLSVDMLAERVWLSRYHFMRLFKAQTGQTVHAYVRQKRLLCAARMIREGTPAIEAAAQCGFHDYSSFHRAFLASFGCTPGSIKN